MNIAIAQQNYHVGNLQANSNKIIQAIHAAKDKDADIIAFPELAICGYPPRDLLEYPHFIDDVEECIEKIAQETSGILVILGAPERNQHKGKGLFNTAFIIADKEIKSKYRKWLLPTYDVFDEYRYFEPWEDIEVFKYKDKSFLITICEDIWNVEPFKIYEESPLEYIKEPVDFVLNISASPFHNGHYKERMHVAAQTAKTVNAPLIYVNHVGAQTELVFDGGSFVVNANGDNIKQLPFFEESISIFSLSSSENSSDSEIKIESIEHIHKAILLGIKDYFGKLGFTKATLGLSGGIDSALVYVLACQALGSENVLPVLMPSEYSSEGSITDSQALIQNVKGNGKEISIQSLYQEALQVLSPQFGDKPFDVTEENIQSRLRALILMAISNKHGYILLNTSNKSETAVGYGTLYGDMCGALGPIADLYKTKVYELARFINQEKEIIPTNIIEKPPSAELRPDQLDSDSLPPYNQLDAILYAFIEEKLSTQQIVEKGYDIQEVKRIIKLVHQNEFKRHQTPPILRVSPKAFGMGRRFPIVSKYQN